MAHLPYVQYEDASPEVKVLFDSCERMLGRVANAIRVAAHSPKIAQALVGLLVPTNRAEITEVLDIRTKALVILKTSMLNGCDYCIGHNVTLGRACGLSDRQIEALEGDFQNSQSFTPALNLACRSSTVPKLTIKRNSAESQGRIFDIANQPISKIKITVFLMPRYRYQNQVTKHVFF